MDARKIFETKQVVAASVSQGKRYAERWCAARLYRAIPLREAVERLTDNTPLEPESPMPALPPALEQQQQARCLAKATVAATASVGEALEPVKSRVKHSPSAQEPMGDRVSASFDHLEGLASHDCDITPAGACA